MQGCFLKSDITFLFLKRSLFINWNFVTVFLFFTLLLFCCSSDYLFPSDDKWCIELLKIHSFSDIVTIASNFFLCDLVNKVMTAILNQICWLRVSILALDCLNISFDSNTFTGCSRSFKYQSERVLKVLS